jgi:hypothetical protein
LLPAYQRGRLVDVFGVMLRLLITATSIGVIVYFGRHPSGENIWRRLIATVLAAALLVITWLATANFDSLPGVAPDSPVRGRCPRRRPATLGTGRLQPHPVSDGVEGRIPVRWWIVRRTAGRGEYADQLPAILVTGPHIGERLSSPVTVAGTAAVPVSLSAAPGRRAFRP